MQILKAEFLAVGEARGAIFWPPGSKEGVFVDLSPQESSRDVIPLWLTGPKAPINQLTNPRRRDLKFYVRSNQLRGIEGGGDEDD